MAITALTEISEGRTGSWEFDGNRRYTRKFKAYSDSNSDGPIEVRAYFQSITQIRVGRRYQNYTEYDNLARCTNLKINQDPADPLIWNIEVEYNSKIPGMSADPLDFPENPLLRPAEWTYSWQQVPKTLRYDLDGEEFVNSAKTPFDPPPEINYTSCIIKISLYKAYNVWTPSYIAAYQNRINSATWFGLPAHSVLVQGAEASSVFENDVLCWKVTWTLATAPGPDFKWHPTKILDAGYYELVDGKQKLVRDMYGAPLSTPTLLNGGGQKTIFDPTFLEFKTYQAVNFTGAIP